MLFPSVSQEELWVPSALSLWCRSREQSDYGWADSP